MKYNYNFNDEEFDEELEELINEAEYYRKSNKKKKKKKKKNSCEYCEFMSVENCYKCKNNPEKKIYNK